MEVYPMFMDQQINAVKLLYYPKQPIKLPQNLLTFWGGDPKIHILRQPKQSLSKISAGGSTITTKHFTEDPQSVQLWHKKTRALNRGSRNKTTFVATWFLTDTKNTLQMVLGKPDLHRQKTEMKFISLTLHKSPFKIVQRLQYKIQNFETTRKDYREIISKYRHSPGLSEWVSSNPGMNGKDR